MKGIRVLEIGAEGLSNIALPALNRPPVKPNENPTEELVQWGIKVYVYSVIAHVRTILNGLLVLGKSGNIPASEILSRHMFEWTAHACYMSQKITEFAQQKNWRGAWELLTRAATGNYWAKQHGTKYAPSNASIPTGLPNSLRVPDLIEAYEKYQVRQLGHADAKDTYSLLCEFSHPNSTCLQHYHSYKGAELTFSDPDPEASTLPVVNWCIIDLLMFLQALLALAQDNEVLTPVVVLLKKIAALAPSNRP